MRESDLQALANLGRELSQLRQGLEGHFAGDEATMRAIHSELTALRTELREQRTDLSDLDTRFQVHVQKYTSDQEGWALRWGQAPVLRPVSGGAVPHSSLNGELQRLLYMAAGAGGGVAALVEGVRWILEAVKGHP